MANFIPLYVLITMIPISFILISWHSVYRTRKAAAQGSSSKMGETTREDTEVDIEMQQIEAGGHGEGAPAGPASRPRAAQAGPTAAAAAAAAAGPRASPRAPAGRAWWALTDEDVDDRPGPMPSPRREDPAPVWEARRVWDAAAESGVGRPSGSMERGVENGGTTDQ